MPSSKTFIKLENCTVKGINTAARASSIRNMILQGGSLSTQSIPIINNANLNIKSGERIAFIGGNGSGKSSLLKLIAGIYPPAIGKVYLNGSVGALIEMGLGIEPELSGRHNIKLQMLYNNMLHIYSKNTEKAIIEFAELEDKIDLPIKHFSSGMLARLIFSSTIFNKPDILLLDEVFATGDSKFIEKSFKFMQSKINQTPITIIVSHDEKIIKENCTRGILVDKGNIVADGNVDHIFNLYHNS